MRERVRVRIELERQRLFLYRGKELVASYAISTSRDGPGEQIDSGCTPCGLHRIRIKIGDGEPENSVFVGRRPTGEIYTSELGQQQPQRDWILTRILWLTGLESGRNRGGRNDTLRRFIYIHGCPDSESMDVPLSHGCIRMRNSDLLDLYPCVDTATIIEIV